MRHVVAAAVASRLAVRGEETADRVASRRDARPLSQPAHGRVRALLITVSAMWKAAHTGG